MTPSAEATRVLLSQRAFVLPPRLCRRVARRLSPRPYLFGAEPPHAHIVLVTRENAREWLDPSECAVGDGDPGDWLIFLAEPHPLELAREGEARLLARRLFHASIHREFLRSPLSVRDVRAAIAAIGQAEFDEIRLVLKQDRCVLSAEDDREVYVEFVARYLELSHFAPAECPKVFPGIGRDAERAALSGLPFSPDELRQRCRISGDDPTPSDKDGPMGSDGHDTSHGRSRSVTPRVPPPPSAIVHPDVVPGLVDCVRRGDMDGALGVLRVLVGRVLLAIGRPEDERARIEPHFASLLSTLARSSATRWSRPVRFLYDLQKACVAAEREVFSIDPIGTLVTLGAQPLRRPLPLVRLLGVRRALESAYKRLTGKSLAHDLGHAWDDTVRSWLAQAEANFRAEVKQPLARTMEEVGLVPTNLPERVSVRGLVEELLDQVTAHGFLTLGHVRDTIAKSDKKLPNVTAGAWLTRDALLLADRRLREVLAGIYRPGELYMVLLQKGSSLLFGTRPGRLLFLYALLPVVTAFVVLEGLSHIVGPLLHRFHLIDGHLKLTTPYVLAPLTLYVALLIHIPLARQLSVRAARGVGKVLSFLFVEAPRWVLRLPVVAEFLASAAYRALVSLVVKPLVLGAVVLFASRAFSVSWVAAGILGGILYLLTAVLLNTRVGARVEEGLTDAVSVQWMLFTRKFLPGLYRLLVDFFQRVAMVVEGVLYAVDARLRFRVGDGALSVAAKGAFSVLWFFVAYLARFYVNLLIEPQVNPIKHFPVVTVSHKMMIPFLKTLYVGMLGALSYVLPSYLATPLTGATVFLLPGFFGFLVWELKENYKLYEQNRPGTLRPVSIGSHGETMAALLRPGFHSGTVPKAFAKLRRALAKGDGSASKFEHELVHVEESVTRFVERRFLALLEETRAFPLLRVTVDSVHIASNRITVAVLAREPGEHGHEAGAVTLRVEEQSGFLLATARVRGLFSQAPPSFAAALAGLYRVIGVDIVHEELRLQLPADAHYDISADGLVVFRGEDAASTYLMSADEAEFRPSPGGSGLSPILAEAILLSKRPVAYADWVSFWQCGAPTIEVPVRQEG